MSGTQKVIILGNVGNIEAHYSSSGMPICKFSLATSKKKKSGEEVTSWHRCTAFQKTAELIGQYVEKGHQLYVEGELSYGSYEKDGVTVYTTDVIVNQFTFIGGQKKQDNQQQNQQGFQNQQQQQSGGFQQQNSQQQQTQDDIPF